MRADVVLLPSELKPTQLRRRIVVVLDVLRATTTMIAALAAGVREIRIFPNAESVRSAKVGPEILRCGEENCLKPIGFDLGNSPGTFGPTHKGKTLLMSTTNGTKAILAARGAEKILVGGLINAKAVAQQLRRFDRDVILLCAGTQGEIAVEDMLGAGAILDALGRDVQLESKSARLALLSFQARRDQLPQALRETIGGMNVIKANLEEDIDYAARLDSHHVVGVVEDGDPIRIALLPSAARG